jgi:hypothetical protein
MSETIQMSPAVEWFTQEIVKFRSENDIDLDHPDYKISYLSDWLQLDLDYEKDPMTKITGCVELATILLETAWIEHCKQQEKP